MSTLRARAALRGLLTHKLEDADGHAVEILPGLFLGSSGCIRLWRGTHIVRCAPNLPDVVEIPPSPVSRSSSSLVRYLDLDMTDKGDFDVLRKALLDARSAEGLSTVEFIDEGVGTALREPTSTLTSATPSGSAGAANTTKQTSAVALASSTTAPAPAVALSTTAPPAPAVASSTTAVYHGGVLICCLQGKSRSVSILLGYLMLARRLPLDEGLQLVREKRPQIAPNMGFMLCLRRFEREMLRANADGASTFRADELLAEGASSCSSARKGRAEGASASSSSAGGAPASASPGGVGAVRTSPC